MKSLDRIMNAFGNLFFPHICCGCGSDLLQEDQFLCLRCFNNLPLTYFTGKDGNPVEKIFWGRAPFYSAASVVYFSKATMVARILHQLKYKGKKEIGEWCGRMMGQALLEQGLDDNIDALVPLPLHPKKQKLRGYNQATMLCNGIASVINKPVLENVVKRNSFTETQTRKSRTERWENIGSKFELVEDKPILNSHVLLVDDVITTGATLEACGSRLLEAKGCRVSIFTFAYSSSTGYF